MSESTNATAFASHCPPVSTITSGNATPPAAAAKRALHARTLVLERLSLRRLQRPTLQYIRRKVTFPRDGTFPRQR